MFGLIITLSHLQSDFSTAGGSQQVCYSQPGCVGDIVTAPGPSARDCCAGTDDGQSYSNDGVNCHVSQCIGMCALILSLLGTYVHGDYKQI